MLVEFGVKRSHRNRRNNIKSKICRWVRGGCWEQVVDMVGSPHFRTPIPVLSWVHIGTTAFGLYIYFVASTGCVWGSAFSSATHLPRCSPNLGGGAIPCRGKEFGCRRRHGKACWEKHRRLAAFLLSARASRAVGLPAAPEGVQRMSCHIPCRRKQQRVAPGHAARRVGRRPAWKFFN